MSLWSDQDLVALAARFVPATDEVWRLQGGTDPECLAFQRMADTGHYRGKGGTRQGLYVVTPGGALLASCNTHDSVQVRTLLTQALADWQALPDDRRVPAPPADYAPRHRWESSRPRNGLILTSTVRDLPVPPTPDAAQRKPWNRDHAWFTSAEARQWLPAEPVAGATHTIARPILERLICFHLVDNVRGQTLPFAPPDIVSATLTSTVVGRSDHLVRLAFEGNTEAVTQGKWMYGEIHWKPATEHPRGLETRLTGHATYDLAAERFVEFELIALGQRRGFTENNARRDDPGPAPIGFVFELAPESRASEVPPTFVDLYRVDWVK